MLDIVYQDDVLVAIHKPSGLLVHRSPIDRHETRFVLQILRDQLGQYVYPVHRLDKPTSGLLLFALSPEIARELSLQFERGEVGKRYLAVVRGHAPEVLDIDHSLRDEVNQAGQRIDGGTSRDARTALTCQRYWTLPLPVDRYPEARYSLVQLSPRTGRYRQLRRHMKHIAHPIIGDTRYGKGSHNRFFREHLGGHRLMLAATGMRVTHPLTDKPLTLPCPPGNDFMSVLGALDRLDTGSVEATTLTEVGY